MDTERVITEAAAERPATKERARMPAKWEQEMITLLRRMIGPRPRMATIRWDGSAFFWHEANPPKRVAIDE